MEEQLTQAGVRSMIVAQYNGGAGERDSWASDRGSVRVSDAIGDEALQDALDALLA